MYSAIRTALQASLPAELVDRLLGHHRTMRVAARGADWEKALLRGGKFAETIMKIVHHERTGNIVTQIHVDDEIEKAASAGNLPSELRTLVPRHARIMYDHRNKRGGGHDSFDPAEMDVKVSETAGDWCLAELLRVFGGLDSATALAMTRAITTMRLPLVQEIDGEAVILQRGGSARQDMGLLLYFRHPQRVSRTVAHGIAGHNEGAIRMAIVRMKEAKEIHENSDGLLLTDRGIALVEEVLAAPERNTVAPQKGSAPSRRRRSAGRRGHSRSVR